MIFLLFIEYDILKCLLYEEDIKEKVVKKLGKEYFVSIFILSD